MKHWWIEYRQEWTQSPMTRWVHTLVNAMAGQIQQIEPPLPQPVVSKGYPIYFVTVGRFTFRFSSLHELDQCVETLAQKVLPSTIVENNGNSYYANSHWLSRLPGKVKSWRYRQQAIKVLIKARAAFVKELA